MSEAQGALCRRRKYSSAPQRPITGVPNTVLHSVLNSTTTPPSCWKCCLPAHPDVTRVVHTSGHDRVQGRHVWGSRARIGSTSTTPSQHAQLGRVVISSGRVPFKGQEAQHTPWVAQDVGLHGCASNRGLTAIKHCAAWHALTEPTQARQVHQDARFYYTRSTGDVRQRCHRACQEHAQLCDGLVPSLTNLPSFVSSTTKQGMNQRCHTDNAKGGRAKPPLCTLHRHTSRLPGPHDGSS